MADDRFADVKHRIHKEMVEECIPSVAVAVAQHGRILWQEAFGWADRESRIPADVHTSYYLASVSKPITATAVMNLVNQGLIDLDTPINHYLGRDCQIKVRVGNPDDVTVRRVANHTSGLPLHSNVFQGETLKMKPPMAETIRRYGNVVTAPGERYRYSNLGYGILDYLVACVSGMSYAEFLRREIFLPLGMTRSAVEITPPLENFAAVRYDHEQNRIPENDCDHRGASSVYNSVHDLLRFGMLHLKQCQPDQKFILSEKSIEAMQIPTAAMTNPQPADVKKLRSTAAYGVGWVINDDEFGLRISHSGGMGGCASRLLLMPGEGIIIAAVSNLFKSLPYIIERDILSQLLPGYADKLTAFDDKKQNTSGEAQDTAFKPPPELAGDWQGTVYTYEEELPFRLSFKPSGEIYAQLGIQLWTLVNEARFDDGWFTGKLAGNVNTSDTTRSPYHPFHHLDMELKLRGDVINGAVINVAGCKLNHWVELQRA